MSVLKPLARQGLLGRFLLVSAVPVIAMLILIAIAHRSLTLTGASAKEMVTEVTTELDSIIMTQTAIVMADDAFHVYLSAPTGESSRELLRSTARVDAAFRRVLNTDFGRMGERRPLPIAAEAWHTAAAVAEETAPPINAPRSADVADVLTRYNQSSRSALASLRQAHTSVDDEVRDLGAEIVQVREQAVVTTMVTGIIALILTLLATAALAHWLLKPISELIAVAEHLGAGDLSSRVVKHGPNELGELADSFNSMAERLKEHTDELEASSVHDFLTGVFNRREFRWRVDEEVERCKRYGGEFTLVLLDVDFLKAINDGLGHLAGDKALCLIAGTLVKLSRPSDLVARYGGDEFVVLMPETGDQAALAAAERIIDNVKSLSVKGRPGTSVRLSVSAGVAAFPGAAMDRDELLAAADKALYMAKQSGRAQAHIYEDGKAA